MLNVEWVTTSIVMSTSSYAAHRDAVDGTTIVSNQRTEASDNLGQGTVVTDCTRQIWYRRLANGVDRRRERRLRGAAAVPDTNVRTT